MERILGSLGGNMDQIDGKLLEMRRRWSESGQAERATTALDIKGSGSAFEAQGPLEDQFIPIFSIKGLLVKMKSYLALMLPLALGVLSQQPLCPGGLYGNALCCDTDVLGVVDIDCTVRRWHPTSCSPLLRHS